MDKEKFWAKKYERNIERLVGVCFRYVGDRALAEDLAHESFLKAMERSDTYRTIGSFDAWLTRITINHTISFLRNQPEVFPLTENEMDVPSHDEGQEIRSSDISNIELMDALQKLPVRQRAVFNLYVIDGYSHRRIADTLDISITNSKQLLLRARLRLQQLLAGKIKTKDKKAIKKGILMIPLLFPIKRATSHRLDRLYRSRLSILRMTPARKLSVSEISQAAAASPTSAGLAIAAGKTALLVTAATTAVGGTCAWQISTHTPLASQIHGNPSTNSITVTSENLPPCQTAKTDSVSETMETGLTTPPLPKQPSLTLSRTYVDKHHASSSTKTSKTQVPAPVEPTETVIITTEVPVIKTIVTHDTVVVHDTVRLLKNQ